MLKSSLFFAFSLAVLVFVTRLILDTFLLDWNYRMYFLILAGVLAAYGGMYFQRKDSNEAFTFVMDLKFGLQSVAIFGLATAFLTYVFYHFIHPGFLENFAAERRLEIIEKAMTENVSSENLATMLQNFDTFADLLYTPFRWATLTLVGILLMGFFYALILAIMARKAKGMFSF